MATFRKSCGYATAAVTLFFALVSTTVHADAVTIANSFKSPTEIQCYSQVHIDTKYTAAPGEVYIVGPFDAAANQFWDCEIYNQQWNKLGTFRLWGDASHGGPEVEGCTEDCHWQVDEFQVSAFIDGTWHWKHSWP